MASADPSIPDKDSAEYEAYLSQIISEEEDRLKRLQEKTRIAEMEAQLAGLLLQTANLNKSLPGASPHTPPSGRQETRGSVGRTGGHSAWASRGPR